MNSLNNINRIILTNEIIKKLIKIYEFKGKNFYYNKVLSKSSDIIRQQLIEKDTYFFVKYFDDSISNKKIKSLIKHNKGFSKEELHIINLKKAFEKIQTNIDNFELLPNEILNLIKFIHPNCKDASFKIEVIQDRSTLFTERKNQSKRKYLEELLNLYTKLEKNDEELIILISNFYIDFMNLDLFQNYNDELGILLLFILSLYEGFDCFKYISFFEILYPKKDKLKDALLHSSYSWKEGFSQPLPMINLIIEILLESYKNLDDVLDDYLYDSKLNKTDNIENTIMKLNNIFSKTEIKNIHPYVSESTINRTLKRLKDENKIKPIGTGRSAKWLKLVAQPEKFKIPKQMGLFDFIDEQEKENDDNEES